MPLIDIVADAGAFAAVALLEPSETLNKRILGAGDIISPNKMVEDFKAATGKEAKVVHISYDQFKSYLPKSLAEELAANMQLIEDWYYPGSEKEEIQKSIDLVVKAGFNKPRTWKEFVAKNFKA
jgi:NmrA-like family